MGNVYLDKEAEALVEQIRRQTGVKDMTASQALRWLAERVPETKVRPQPSR